MERLLSFAPNGIAVARFVAVLTVCSFFDFGMG